MPTDLSTSSATSGAGSLDLAATGDSLVTRRLSTLEEPAFVRVLEILRGANAAFTNLETTIHDGKGFPAAESGGTWMLSPPCIAEELRWAGLVLLARANNHALDWGIEGMRETSRLLDEQGLTHAGAGDDLAGARRAVVRETPAGRIALVSATSTFPPWSRAGSARGEVSGRPGINPLRWAKVQLLGPQAFSAMRSVAAELGIAPSSTDHALRLFDSIFVPWERTGLGVDALPQDVAGNLASIREARGRADWVVVSLHTHEDGGSVHAPAPFAVAFARQCVDSGADVVLMHGSHVLRGIEIHHGRPIFYGLGNFIYQANLVERLPADAFERFDLPEDADDEAVFARLEQLAAKAGTSPVAGRSPHLVGSAYSVLARLRWSRGGLAEIRLHPLTLGPDEARAQCGYPRLATGACAEEILQLMRSLSAPFGTNVVARDGCGIVELAPAGR
jgi:poly-gamma-glutamate synthesis protein (capsule biosynthesis protein)